MLFASAPLAGRIERAEARLAADGAAASDRRRPGRGAFALPIGGGFATFAGAASPLNKVAGLGFAGPVAESELGAVEAAYAERGCPVQVELSCLADPSIGALLTRRGYALVGFENVLGRLLPLETAPTPTDGIVVSPSPENEVATWTDVVATGFDSPDAQGVPSHEQYARETVEAAIGDMAAAGVVRYLARRDGRPAGGASLRLSDGVAQLCGAATLPEHRRRGVQGALLAARLDAAGRAGCDVAVVTTQPGSKSQENAQRRGFELLYTRAVLVRAPEPK
jgi:GNAT superfamily N-acetyltransferase